VFLVGKFLRLYFILMKKKKTGKRGEPATPISETGADIRIGTRIQVNDADFIDNIDSACFAPGAGGDDSSDEGSGSGVKNSNKLDNAKLSTTGISISSSSNIFDVKKPSVSSGAAASSGAAGG